MSLRRRQREHTVSVILEAASGVFAEKGFHGTSMEDVAQAVGCAPATLYGYFKGKGELFTRLITDSFADYLDGVDGVLKQTQGFGPTLDAYLEHFTGWHLRNEHLARLLLSMFRAGEREVEPDRELKEAHEQRHVAALCQLMQWGIDEGRLRPDPAITHAISLIALLHGHAFAHLLGLEGTSMTDVTTVVRRVFLDGSIRSVS